MLDTLEAWLYMAEYLPIGEGIYLTSSRGLAKTSLYYRQETTPGLVHRSEFLQHTVALFLLYVLDEGDN